MSRGHGWNHTDMGSSATLSHTNINLTGLGLDLGLESVTLETNSLSHGMAFENSLIYVEPTYSVPNLTDNKLATFK
jgi:hypothetical protein